MYGSQLQLIPWQCLLRTAPTSTELHNALHQGYKAGMAQCFPEMGKRFFKMPPGLLWRWSGWTLYHSDLNGQSAGMECFTWWKCVNAIGVWTQPWQVQYTKTGLSAGQTYRQGQRWSTCVEVAKLLKMNCWFVSKRFTCCCCGTNELAVFAITHLEGFVFKRSPKPVKVQLLQCCLQLSWGVLFGQFQTAQQHSNTSTFKVCSCSFSTRCSSGFHCLELKASLVYTFFRPSATDETRSIQVSTSDTALVYSAQLLGSTGPVDPRKLKSSDDENLNDLDVFLFGPINLYLKFVLVWNSLFCKCFCFFVVSSGF